MVIFLCFVVAILFLVHDVEAIFHLPKLQFAFHGHHSYFRKYFEMLLAVNIGHLI